MSFTAPHTLTDHFIGLQHPFLGIDPRRCQRQLTLVNWQHSGILIGDTYLFVAGAFQARGRVKGYCVNSWSIAGATFIHQNFFADLDTALYHANWLAQDAAATQNEQVNTDIFGWASRALTAHLSKT